MITGRNTEVLHAELSFHVQTEDKGSATAIIESLLYLGGQVLAAVRTDYSDVLAEGYGAQEVAALMDRQHQTMIAAVDRGRFDDKVAALSEVADEREVEERVAADGSEVATPEAQEMSLDDMILDYLSDRQQGETLVLSVDNDSELAGGCEVGMVVRAVSSRGDAPVEAAEIEVRIISSTGSPRPLAAGLTGSEGIAELSFRIPELVHGRAALIVAGSSAIGRAELKYLLR